MIEVGLFAAKAAVIVLSLISIIIVIALITARASHKPELEVEQVHKNFKNVQNFLKAVVLDKADYKDEMKKEKKRQKAEKKSEKKKQNLETGTSSPAVQKRIFLVRFKGDVKASQVDNLTHELNAILQLATEHDEVVANVESPGGVVHGYGLAASQLLRVRQKNIPLTVCVDKVAASGGYMMACVANKILAAPFAILGSIGVVAQVPNFNKVLKKYDVDYKEYTAGEYKRTVSMLGEITPKGEQKFQDQLEDTHILFKNFVGQFRPQINLKEIATGEYWFGERAKTHGLVDELMTSDEYLLKAYQADTPIYEVKFQQKRPLGEKIADFMGEILSQITVRFAETITEKVNSKAAKASLPSAEI